MKKDLKEKNKNHALDAKVKDELNRTVEDLNVTDPAKKAPYVNFKAIMKGKAVHVLAERRLSSDN